MGFDMLLRRLHGRNSGNATIEEAVKWLAISNQGFTVKLDDASRQQWLPQTQPEYERPQTQYPHELSPLENEG